MFIQSLILLVCLINDVFYNLFIYYYIGYIIGYTLVFLLASFLNMTQPALVYVSVVSIIINIIVSKLRNQLKDFWVGKSVFHFFLKKPNRDLKHFN